MKNYRNVTQMMAKWQTGFAATAILVCTVLGAESRAQANGPGIDDPVKEQFVIGENKLKDIDREYLIDNNYTHKGQIDVGDAIRGHAVWNKLNGNPLGSGPGGRELTSVFQALVTGKQQVGFGQYQLTFGPDPSFAEAQALGLGGQAMLIFYEDASADVALDYTDTTSPYSVFNFDDGTPFFAPNPADVSNNSKKVHEEAFIATATDGDYFWALGFTGQVVNGAATAADGEGWATSDPTFDNVLPLFLTPKSIDFDGSQFSLNRLTSPVEAGVGDNIALAGMTSQFDSNYEVDFNGSRRWHGLLGTKTAFEIPTSTKLSFTVIPLPPAAAMGLLMLAGMGGMKLWRRHQGEIV